MPVYMIRSGATGPVTWPAADLIQLGDLWALGYSSAEIGRQMNRTKNAIIGKVRRLELDARPSPIHRSGLPPVKDRPLPAPKVRRGVPTLAPLAPPAATPPPVVIAPPVAVRAAVVAPAVVIHPPALRHTRTCQFIAGTGRPWTKCGKPVAALGNPYCATCGKGLRIPIRRRAGADDAA